MEHSLVRFNEVVAGGWGQPYRYERVQIPSDEVVEVDPNQYRRQTNQKLGLIGPDPMPEMKAALLSKGSLKWPVMGTSWFPSQATSVSPCSKERLSSQA